MPKNPISAKSGPKSMPDPNGSMSITYSINRVRNGRRGWPHTLVEPDPTNMDLTFRTVIQDALAYDGTTTSKDSATPHGQSTTVTYGSTCLVESTSRD